MHNNNIDYSTSLVCCVQKVRYRVKWVKHLQIARFGGVWVDIHALSGLSMKEVKHMHIEVYGMEES